jgi:hypothetical protein
VPELEDRVVAKAGFKLIIKHGSLAKAVQNEVTLGMWEAGRIYLRAIRDHISLDDHSLEELARLGYPYAVHTEAQPVHSDDSWVHVQTGKLRDSFKLLASEESSRKFSLYVTSNVPYMNYLIYGTRFMRPRPFHIAAYNEVRRELWQPVQDHIKAVARYSRTETSATY